MTDKPKSFEFVVVEERKHVSLKGKNEEKEREKEKEREGRKEKTVRKKLCKFKMTTATDPT